MRWLDQFTVLLLDMNGTFMFGHDRFGPDEDYFATYQGLGGGALSRERVHQVLEETCAKLFRDYRDPDRTEDFPSVAEALVKYGNVQESEVAPLERVFAAQEMGRVPAAHGEFLKSIAKTHELGIVSNLWAGPEPWIEQLNHLGLLALFQVAVFSSEGRSIKPSRRLFERALAPFPAGAKIAFVGDSLERDILPAKAMGLGTAWIAPAGSSHAAADVVVRSLPELTEAKA